MIAAVPSRQITDYRFTLHISAVSFMSYVGFAFLNPSFPLALESIGFSQTQIGLVASLGGASLVCASLLGTRILRRFRWQTGLAITLVAGVLGHLGFALFTLLTTNGQIGNGSGFLGLTLSRGTVTFAFALTQIVILHALADQSSGRGYAGITAANALGIVFGPVLGGILANTYLLLPIYSVFAFSLFDLVLCLPWLAMKTAADHTAPEPAKDAPWTLLLLPAAFAFIVMTCLASMQLAMPLALSDALSLPPEPSARLAGYGLLWGGIGLVLSNIALMVRPNLSPEKILPVATFIAAIGFIVLAQVSDFYGFCVALFIVGLGIGPAIPAYTRLATERHGKEASAAIVLVQSLGLMIGPYFGVLLLGQGLLFEVNAALLILSNLLLIGHRKAR